MTQFHITKQNGAFMTENHTEHYIEMVRSLPDGDYTVSAKKKTKRRSLQASALFHVG